MDDVTEYVPEEDSEEITVSTATVEEEVALHFKRFSQEKQDQIRGLVNYATLMGLDGKDLISIGGRLERVKTSRERVQNRALAESVVTDNIGKDRRHEKWRRFRIKTTTGNYYFDVIYGDWKITNPKTKTKVTYTPEYNDWGRINYDQRRYLDICLAVATGEIKLNF